MEIASAVLISLYFIVLTVLVIYGLQTFYLMILQRRRKVPLTDKPLLDLNQPDLPFVTIQLPVYNEKFVIKRLLEAVVAIDYPHDKLEIQVLDDSTDDSKELTASLVNDYQSNGIPIFHITRPDRSGFKAGALKHGLQLSKGELIAIFDADFIPQPGFLRQTLPYFESPRTGLVQARWGHLNRDESMLTQVQAINLDAHFLIEQLSRNQAGFFINFNGTGGIWRKECILDAGNWHADTLTEDLDLSYRAQLKGWHLVFRPDIICPAELPPEINSWKSQQYRWAKGAIETAGKILRTVLSSPLPVWKKIQSTFHLTANIVYPMVVLLALLNLPLIIIRHEGVVNDTFFNLMSYGFVAFVSGLSIFLFIQDQSPDKRWTNIFRFPAFLAYNMGLSINNSIAVIQAFSGYKTDFIRTPKFNRLPGERRPARNPYIKMTQKSIIYTEIAMGFYCFIALFIAVMRFELSIIPFLMLFTAGFFTLGVGSLQIQFEKKGDYHGNRS